jgi:hypothetical protein
MKALELRFCDRVIKPVATVFKGLASCDLSTGCSLPEGRNSPTTGRCKSGNRAVSISKTRTYRVAFCTARTRSKLVSLIQSEQRVDKRQLVFTDLKARHFPSPNSNTTLNAPMAVSFSGTSNGSSFLVRGMLSTRDFQSTMSHVKPYWLPLRRRVLMARSSSGGCAGHFFSTVSRRFFSSSSVRNRTRLLSSRVRYRAVSLRFPNSQPITQ